MTVPAAPTAGEPIAEAWGDVVHDSIVGMDIQVGTVTVSFTASSLSNSVAFTFARPFAAVPICLVSGSNGPHYTASVVSLSTTGGFAQGRRGDGSTPTTTMPISWIAYGPRA